MTIITRYLTAPANPSALPALAWNTGLSPNRRWVPASLPADEAPVPVWTSQYGNLDLGPRVAGNLPVVATEAGIRYAYCDGTAGQGFNVDIADPASMRTVVIIARPEVGDTIVGSGRIARFGDTGVLGQEDAENATATGVSESLAATRGKWHVYSVSVPAVGTVDEDGILAVDGNSTTFPYSDAAWTASALRIAASSGANARELRVLEVITSAGTFDADALTALYAKAVAWYPGLEW